MRAMFSHKVWLVIITNALLLQRCIADESLSTIKTSSGRSSYLNAESQNSNIEITPDSFSKSDSSFAASQSEISQADSSIVNTGDGISIQDSSSYSSSNNVSSSNSDTVVSDGLISQTDSNFASSSSKTSESDSSFTATPDGAIMSSTTSSSTSTSSTSSTTSQSIGGQFLDASEADISFPDEDLLPSNSPYQTKSLDSIPDFPNNSLQPNEFSDLPFSKFPPSNSMPLLGSPNSKFPTNFNKFPNSLMNNNSFKKFSPNDNYLPVGAFNSKLTPKIGTPASPPFSNSPSNSLLNSKPLNSQTNNPLHNNDFKLPPQQPFDTLPTSQTPGSNFPINNALNNLPLNSPSDITSNVQPFDTLPTSQIPGSNFPIDNVSNNSPLNSSSDITNNVQSPSPHDTFQPSLTDLSHNDLISNDISSPNISPMSDSNLLHSTIDQQPSLHESPSENTSVDSIPQNVGISTTQIPSQSSEQYDSLVAPMNSNSPHQLPESNNFSTNSDEHDIPIEFYPDSSGQIPQPSDFPNHQFSPYDDLTNSDSNFPTEYPYDSFKNDVPASVTPYDSTLYPDDHTISPTDAYAEPLPLESMDTDKDGFISPEEILQSSNPTQTILESEDTDQNGIVTPEEVLDSHNPSTPITLESVDSDQNGMITPNEILDSNSPVTQITSNQDDFISPVDLTTQTTLESVDADQNGIITPDETLDFNNPASLFTNQDENELSNSPSLASTPSTFAEKLEIPNLAYSPQNEHDNFNDLLENTKYPSPDQLSPHYQSPTPFYGQPSTPIPNLNYNYPPKPRFPPYGQVPRPLKPVQPPMPQTYLDLLKPYPNYPRNKYPTQFPSNNFLSPTKYANLGENPFYPPYIRNDLLNNFPMSFSPYYRSPYNLPLMPSPYNFPGNFLPPSPLRNYPFKPDYYNISPPISPPNPLPHQPAYSYQQTAFDLPQRPQYIPKDWSKINSSPSIANLDSFPLNNSQDILPNSTPLESLDSTVPGSFSPQSSISSDSNNYLPSPIPGSSSLNDHSLVTPDSVPYTTMDSDNSLPLSTMDSPLYHPDSTTNTPLQTPDYPSSSLPNHNSIDDEIFNILKHQYETTTTEYQLSNSIYPQNISPNFDSMTDEELTFDFVVLGSSPAVLSALKTLASTGKSILLVERGDLPPHISKSLYYRPKILQSNYVRQIKSSAPHCDAEKILYVPNVLGEESTYDSNVWDYGVRSKYIKWGKMCKKWTWNNIVEYFTDGSNESYTYSIPTATEIENTKAVTTITSIFGDAGLYRTEYQKGKRLEGLTVIPYLQENGENIILAEKIFQQLTSYTNIKFALETTPETIVFDDIGKAIGVVVKTSCGIKKTVYILDELIIGSNPVDTVQFLYQSGIGDHERLQQLHIPTQINLPYVGKELIITPLHFGVLYLFPQGTLLNDDESDFIGKDYLFGNYRFPSALAVDYLKAALNIYESREANVVFNFRVFSKSMSERLSSYIERLKHIDEKIKDFLTNLCQEYDLLLAVPQLTNVLSRGEIMIANTNGQFEALVDTGMFKTKRDITIMQKALKVLKSIAETEIFKSMNGKVVQIPVEQCGVPDFSTEYNKCSIRYLSLPNLHFCGGTIMGTSPLTSVVNEDLVVHGTKNVRIFSASVVPYGTSTDSSAVSSMIGNLGAHILLQNYV